MRDISVEALFPQGRERFELGSSGWSRVFGLDAVGGSPYCDFVDEGDQAAPAYAAVAESKFASSPVAESVSRARRD